MTGFPSSANSDLAPIAEENVASTALRYKHKLTENSFLSSPIVRGADKRVGICQIVCKETDVRFERPAGITQGALESRMPLGTELRREESGGERTTCSSESDPIAELLEKLYLPNWLAADMCLRAPWGLAVPDNTVCLYIVMRGGGWLHSDTNDEPLRLSAGDHVITTRGFAHRVSANLADQTRSVSEMLEEASNGPLPPELPGQTRIVYGQFQLQPLDQNPLRIGLPEIVHLNHRRDRELASCLPLLHLIQATRQEANRGWQLTIRRLSELVLINTLAVELARRTKAESESGEFRLMHAATDSAIGPVLRSLVEQPEAHWTIPLMAQIAGTSKSAFSERFRNLVGQPPLQYLKEIRMQKACRLLKDSNVDISNIATLVGYESISSFSNTFKRWNGTSPGEFRRHQRA